ncbi:MAG: porin [Pseudomonadota bacterium]
MNYRTTICACAALMSIAPAWAKDDGPSAVTIYGLIDEGVQYLNNVAVGKSTSNIYAVGSGMATSYFGFRGVENLGGGLKAIFDLQGGFSANNGTSSQGARLFGRQSYVGIEGDFGRLTFGRQYTMRFYATSPINVFGTGAQGITTLDNGVANARADNAVSYRVYLTKELEVGANYSFGRDAVAGTPVTAVATNCPGETVTWKQCKEMSALIKYTASTWGVDSGYERNYGGTAATFGGLTSPKLSDSRFILGGYTKVHDTRLALGWIKRTNLGLATPKSNMVWMTASAPVADKVSFDGMLAQLKYEQSPNKALVIVLRATYSLSKRTVLYVTADHISNGGNLALSASTLAPVSLPQAGGSQLSVITGIKHTF